MKYIFHIVMILLLFRCHFGYGQRYFVAVDIPTSEEIAVDNVKIPLQNQLFGQFEEKEKFHITLKFLGSLSKTKLKNIIQKLQDKLKNSKTFSIQLQTLGFFPSRAKARVVWIGVKSAELHMLQANLENALKAFFSNNRPFKPHVTLARLSCPPPVWLLKDFQSKLIKRGVISCFVVRNILLLRSQSGKYEVVHSFPLAIDKKKK